MDNSGISRIVGEIVEVAEGVVKFSQDKDALCLVYALVSSFDAWIFGHIMFLQCRNV